MMDGCEHSNNNKKSQFKTDSALQNYYPMPQRIVGLEKNIIMYFRNNVKRLNNCKTGRDYMLWLGKPPMKTGANPSAGKEGKGTLDTDTPEEVSRPFDDD